MTGAGRDAFLARVRAALDASGPRGAVPAPPSLEPSLVRRVSPGPDLAERFAVAAEAAGMHVHRTDATSVPRCVQTILETVGAKTVTLSVSAPWTETIVAAAAAAACTVVDWRAAPGLETHYDVDVGITDVDAALAESGTLVVSSSARHSRGTFLVPPVHVAIVRAGQVRPDLVDVWDDVRRTDASATVLVTGPSKTADIEGILITGVHGPAAVHVVLAESDEATERRSDGGGAS